MLVKLKGSTEIWKSANFNKAKNSLRISKMCFEIKSKPKYTKRNKMGGYHDMPPYKSNIGTFHPEYGMDTII